MHPLRYKIRYSLLVGLELVAGSAVVPSSTIIDYNRALLLFAAPQASRSLVKCDALCCLTLNKDSM